MQNSIYLKILITICLSFFLIFFIPIFTPIFLDSSKDVISALENAQKARDFIRPFVQGLIQVQSQGGFEGAYTDFKVYLQASPDFKFMYDRLNIIKPLDETSFQGKIRICLLVFNQKSSFFSYLKNIKAESLQISCDFLDENYYFSQALFQEDISLFHPLLEELINLQILLNSI